MYSSNNINIIPIIIILAGHPVAIIPQVEGVMICVGWGK